MFILEVDVELYCHLMDVIALAFVLFPDMFQIAAGDKYEVAVANDFAAVAHDTTGASRILDEVQLHNVVTMNRIVEFLLVTVGHIHKILFTQRCNFA